MPYITKELRDNLKNEGSAKGTTTANSCGELNYLITNLFTDYLHNKGLSYQSINDILGALEGAKFEFYRRVVVPYENVKISVNGDVYNLNNEDK